MKNAEAVTFSGGRLDRASLRRNDASQAEMRADPRARCLVLWRGKPLFDDTTGVPRLAWLPLDDEIFASATEPAIFLGAEDGAGLYARSVPDWLPPDPAGGPPPFLDKERTPHPSQPETRSFGDLRALMAQLDPGEAGTAAAAKGILGWHATHRFCAMCGSPSVPADAGWRRNCSTCSAQHFPRTDPVVIMLIVHDNALLLGRSSVWPEGMYSLLAGFMEPGESIEAAVRRETFEETGVRVGQVDYLASQPWPFPSSLMIGCRGIARSREIILDPAELEDALWLSREDAVEAMAGRNPGIRPARPGSIARFLIERWLTDRLD